VLWQALRRLPARQRTALVLRYYLDLPEAEVAVSSASRSARSNPLCIVAFTDCATGSEPPMPASG
jgi:hypothetical protein